MENAVEFHCVLCIKPLWGSSEHLNYTKRSMIRALYRFHVCYHVRRVLKRLQVPLLHETGFNTDDNPYTSSEFFKICEDYGVPNDPVKYCDKKFYWSYQCGVGWPNDYIWSRLNDPVDYREIRGFYRHWVVQNIRDR